MIDKKTEKKLGLQALDSIVTTHPLTDKERADFATEKVKSLSAMIDRKDEQIARLKEQLAARVR